MATWATKSLAANRARNRFTAVFSLLQQIYPHNKKEQQSAECIKGSLGVKGKSLPEAPENNVDMIKYKLGGEKEKQTQLQNVP